PKVPVNNTGLNNQEALVDNIENLDDEVQVNYTENLDNNSDEDELNCFKLPDDEYDFLNSCKESKIACKRVLPKTQEEFNILEKLGLTYVSGQYEATDSGKFHEQCYFQFDKRQTITSVKKLFNHQTMNFSKYLNGDSDKNRDYNCIDKRSFARWKASELSSEEIGPWIFGNYRYLGTSTELKK
ncbi:6827_t:CDS:2, partial [Racocetra fulgida]